MKLSALRLVYYALCLAIALTLSYLEALIPLGFSVPGAKIGLANIVSLLLIYTGGFIPALLVGVMRVLLAGFMFGNLFSIVYSLSGLVVSLIVMVFLKKTDLFGLVGVSAAGGVAHNLGQLTAAAALTNAYIFSYAPFLVAFGVLSGVVVGAAGGIVIGRISPFLRKSLYRAQPPSVIKS